MYSINDVSMMSGFSDRTLRNYMNLGLLHGEKINGKWQFTAEDLGAFFADPNVKQGLKIKDKKQIFDFIANDKKTESAACIVLDLAVNLAEGNRISALFCDLVNEQEDVKFSYTFDHNHARVVLTGPEQQVRKIMETYYKR